MKKETLEKNRWMRMLRVLLPVILLLLLAWWVNPYFFTGPIFGSILKDVALLATLAMGESLIMASGEIDLSLPNTALLSAGLTYYLAETENFGIWGIMFGIAAGVVIGLLNGVLIAGAQISAILVTVSTAVLARGISGALTNNLALFDTAGRLEFFRIMIGGIVPVSLLIAIGVLLTAVLLFRYTTASRKVFAVGGSERSARLSGLPVDRIRILCYTVAGGVAGIAGAMILSDGVQAARFYGGGGSAQLEVLFAPVLGGVSLRSGSRVFIQTFYGAVIVSIFNRMIYDIYIFDFTRSIAISVLVLIVLTVRKAVFHKDLHS